MLSYLRIMDSLIDLFHIDISRDYANISHVPANGTSKQLTDVKPPANVGLARCCVLSRLEPIITRLFGH